MLVRKTLSLSNVEFKANAEKGTFEGYAARFGQKTVDGSAILLKGCFEYTLRKYGKPKMFFGHSWDMPIGRYTKAAEDDAGLYVAGEFTPNLQLAGDVRAAMLHETLDGLSIGGFVKRGDYAEDEDGVMTVERWSRLIEVSPVVFPNLDGARITSVHGEPMEIDDVVEGVESARDFERLLREAAGMSRGQAAAVVARAKKLFSAPSGEPPRSKQSIAEAEAILSRLGRMAGVLDPQT